MFLSMAVDWNFLERTLILKGVGRTVVPRILAELRNGEPDQDGYLVLDSGSPALPVGISEMGVGSQGETPPVRELGLTGRRDCEIHLFKREWVEDHPEFGLWGANCRRYVSDLISFPPIILFMNTEHEH